MKSDNSPTESFNEGKAAVAEMQQRKTNRDQKMEDLESELHSRRVKRAATSITARAEAFFKNAEAGKDTRTLESELQALREQAPLYDVEIERLQAEANRLRRGPCESFLCGHDQRPRPQDENRNGARIYSPRYCLRSGGALN